MFEEQSPAYRIVGTCKQCWRDSHAAVFNDWCSCCRLPAPLCNKQIQMVCEHVSV